MSLNLYELTLSISMPNTGGWEGAREKVFMRGIYIPRNGINWLSKTKQGNKISALYKVTASSSLSSLKIKSTLGLSRAN